MAESIAQGPPIAMIAAKQQLYLSLETNLESFERFAFYNLAYCFNTEDREEGIRSFLEKREARFKGK